MGGKPVRMKPSSAATKRVRVMEEQFLPLTLSHSLFILAALSLQLDIVGEQSDSGGVQLSCLKT